VRAREEGWAGSLQSLVINVQGRRALALREPANIVLGKSSAELVASVPGRRPHRAVRCRRLAARRAIRASYSLANLPLALGNALATADLPVKLEGTLQGHGEIRRTPQGELFGDVLIESDSGSIFRNIAATPGDETKEAPQKLLGYRGFKVAATLPARTRARRSIRNSNRMRHCTARPASTISAAPRLRSPAACAARFRTSRRSRSSRRSSPTFTAGSMPILPSRERCKSRRCPVWSVVPSWPRTFRQSA
jgi:hypothetical protein